MQYESEIIQEICKTIVRESWRVDRRTKLRSLIVDHRTECVKMNSDLPEDLLEPPLDSGNQRQNQHGRQDGTGGRNGGNVHVEINLGGRARIGVGVGLDEEVAVPLCIRSMRMPRRVLDNLDTYARYTGQIDDDGFERSASAETAGRYCNTN